MDIQTQIQQTAVSFFLGILHSCAADQAPFKVLMTIEVDGEKKLLLLTGIAHSRVEDGSCLAVLNPDIDLIERLSGSYACHSSILKEVVAQRCDFALGMWIEAYKNNRVVVGARYRNRTPSPAKFRARDFAK